MSLLVNCAPKSAIDLDVAQALTTPTPDPVSALGPKMAHAEAADTKESLGHLVSAPKRGPKVLNTRGSRPSQRNIIGSGNDRIQSGH